MARIAKFLEPKAQADKGRHKKNSDQAQTIGASARVKD